MHCNADAGDSLVLSTHLLGLKAARPESVHLQVPNNSCPVFTDIIINPAADELACEAESLRLILAFSPDTPCHGASAAQRAFGATDINLPHQLSQLEWEQHNDTNSTRAGKAKANGISAFEQLSTPQCMSTLLPSAKLSTIAEAQSNASASAPAVASASALAAEAAASDRSSARLPADDTAASPCIPAPPQQTAAQASGTGEAPQAAVDIHFGGAASAASALHACAQTCHSAFAEPDTSDASPQADARAVCHQASVSAIGAQKSSTAAAEAASSGDETTEQVQLRLDASGGSTVHLHMLVVPLLHSASSRTILPTSGDSGVYASRDGQDTSQGGETGQEAHRKASSIPHADSKSAERAVEQSDGQCVTHSPDASAHPQQRRNGMTSAQTCRDATADVAADSASSVSRETAQPDDDGEHKAHSESHQEAQGAHFASAHMDGVSAQWHVNERASGAQVVLDRTVHLHKDACDVGQPLQPGLHNHALAPGTLVLGVASGVTQTFSVHMPVQHDDYDARVAPALLLSPAPTEAQLARFCKDNAWEPVRNLLPACLLQDGSIAIKVPPGHVF